MSDTQKLTDVVEGDSVHRLVRRLREAADRIKTLERTLADYIDKSEKLVYGAHGNAYLPGQMRTWVRATHNGKNVVEGKLPLAEILR